MPCSSCARRAFTRYGAQWLCRMCLQRVQVRRHVEHRLNEQLRTGRTF